MLDLTAQVKYRYGMAGEASTELLTDGVFDLTAGVDSGREATVASAQNPNGLSRSQLSWLNNGTVRGGPIGPRDVFNQLGQIHDASSPYQGGKLYIPLTGDPYYLVLVGGHLLQVLCDSPYTVTDLTVKFKLAPFPSNTKAYFCQGAQFMVIQCGAWQPNNPGPLPWFWDGATLSQSRGIIGANNIPGGAQPFNQLPAALAMIFYQGRIWYAQNQQFAAGDIIGGAAGTAQYNETDSVLYVTENPLAIGGDGFSIPQDAGPIVGFGYTMTTDSTLQGEGPLYVFTMTRVYAQTVPITRTDWIAANNNNQPTQIPYQLKFGAISDRSITHVNGDLFYATLEPGVRTIIVASRFYGQWANTPISRNERRVLKYTDPNLMFNCPAINFDNRLLMGALPKLGPTGVVYQSLMSLDFDVLDRFGQEGVTPTGSYTPRLPPAWEGMWQGLNILDMDVQPFSGTDRAFAIVASEKDNSIWLWEIVANRPNVDKLDNGQERIVFVAETPAYDWNNLFLLKKLMGGRLFLDNLLGTVDIEVEYREDSDPCWHPWYQKQIIVPSTQPTTVEQPNQYPAPPVVPKCKGYKFPLTLPEPKMPDCATFSRRPVNWGYQFQIRITVKGQARIRGWLLYAEAKYEAPYEGLNEQ